MPRIIDLESRFREFENSDLYDSKFVFTGDCIQRKGKLGFVEIILTFVPLGFLIPGLLFISEPPAIFGISLIAIGGIGFCLLVVDQVFFESMKIVWN
tara:strand:- start:773 stop:1063 length:291 start_codon:yes stop_codon:yes gene_type:complete